MPGIGSTAHPQSEAALRRMIAEVTRQQLPMLQLSFSSMGQIESVSFTSVDLQGTDVYGVKFGNGAVLTFSIALDPEGKIAMAAVRPGAPLPLPPLPGRQNGLSTTK